MRARLAARPFRQPGPAIVFIAVLVASFFALAPAVQACQSELIIHKVATDDSVPVAVYTVVVSGTTTAGAEFSRTVEVPANGSVSIADVPPGTYRVVELDAPLGATVEPDEVVIADDYGIGTFDVYVTNPAGKLAITKIETGDTAPGATYTFDITGPGDPITATVTAGTTWTSNWLPLGTYTITERDAPTGATINPDVVNLTEDRATVTVTATNPYRDFHGKLAITKIETGDTAPGATYTFDITGPGDPITATVTAGTTWTSNWLPLGTYTITERDAPTGATINPDVVNLTEDRATVTVTATNPYRDFHGKLAITKIETGDTAPGATYTFDITGPGDPITATVTAGTTWTSNWLPLGTYTITERDAPTGATINPDVVNLTEDRATVTVTATNPYRDFHGKLAITKIETGDTAPGATYTFDITGPGDPITATVTAGTTWTSNWLPLGTYTITERDAPTGATINPDVVNLTEDRATVTVTATNPYRDFHGKLAITKIEAGHTGPAGTYTVNVTGPINFVATVTAGTTWISDWLPLGTYTVTEVDAPAGATIDPSRAVLSTDGATVNVTVTNPSFASGALLPATGGGSMTVLLPAAVVIAIGIALMVIGRARRNA